MIKLKKKPVETKNYSVELDNNDSMLFKNFLYGLEATFETSSCYNLVHFSLNLTHRQYVRVSNFLDLL